LLEIRSQWPVSRYLHARNGHYIRYKWYILYAIEHSGTLTHMRKDMTAALRASLHAEERATNDRFSRADELFGSTAPEGPVQIASRTKPIPEHDRVIRDSFTMPAQEYDRIGQTRSRCLKSGVSITKSEVLRAGLAALGQMSEADLLALVRALPKVKTGRPVHSS
jgi:hypothetical protein